MVSISKSHHILFLFLLLIGITQVMPRKLNEEASMREKYEQWMSKFGKAYTNGAEKEKRFLIFKENVEFIESFNAAGNKSYELGVNHLADLTVEEFNAYSNGYKRFSNDESVITPFKYENVTAISAALDWRAKGAVTPIKQQGSCGSCWAFSSIATTEGLHKITTGKLVSLSEQELMDCDRHFGIEHGCEGGGMNDGFEYMIQNGGITSEANYPYKAKDGICDKNKARMHVAKIKGYEKVPINSEAALLKAVANQPVSVAIDANNQGFRFYKRGIFTGNCGTKLDHGVTIVGYGRANGIDYWLVKNSWSTAWGEQGYIRMKRGIADKRGLCGIAMEASYPIS